MDHRRRRLVAPLLVAFTGLVALSSVASSPGFAAYRTVDVVRLVGSGMCFGAALFALVAFFRGRSG
jgi:hypothetical protein